MGRRIIFRQLFDQLSCTYSYLIGCSYTGDALIIDPVLDKVKRDAKIIQDLQLNLKFAINTHIHADHVTGSGSLKKIFDCKSILSAESGGKADLYVSHGETVKVGKTELEVRATPGHTNGCVTYVSHAEEMAFTGDAILIRSCGRTDFQQGDSGKLYDSVHSQILSLPTYFTLFPAHDYQGLTSTTVAEELQFNERLSKSRNDFIAHMQELKLNYPAQIDKSLPANLVCGILDEMDSKTRKAVETSHL